MREWIVGLMLAVGMATAAAQDMQTPRISRPKVDWDAAAADLKDIEEPGVVQSDGPPPAGAAFASLNQATSDFFSNIAASPVPVLLPFDTAAFLRDRAAATPNKSVGDYLSGFHPSPFFLTGPAGYDVVFYAYGREMPGLGIGFSDRIDIHISGSDLLYEFDEPVGLIDWPVNGLKAEIPGIRRVYLENYVRYTFVRYGTPYVVSILCFDGGRSRYRQISCRDADKVATRFVRALHVAGGTAQAEPPTTKPDTIERPAAASTVFTYHGPGQIIPGTGFKGKGGRADYTVYSKIRFPLADAPAYANSQSFMNWGDCDSTGRSSLGMRGKVAVYRCRVSSPLLVRDESAADNYSYPWRDNFCEHRSFYVGQCPGGSGHQGQDIRPGWCKQRIEGANRCEPYLHDVVAVRDGMVLRGPNQQAFHVVVNTPDEHVRFRYLHMFPKQLDEAGVTSGRNVREGEMLGKVGNFDRRERATTYHLHFEMQVMTKYGWAYVNPYMTLVGGYERLIRGRGQEIKDDAATRSATVPTETVPTETALPGPGAQVSRPTGHED